MIREKKKDLGSFIFKPEVYIKALDAAGRLFSLGV